MAEKQVKRGAMARGFFWLSLAVMLGLLAMGWWSAALAWIAPAVGAWILSKPELFDPPAADDSTGAEDDEAARADGPAGTDGQT